MNGEAPERKVPNRSKKTEDIFFNRTVDFMRDLTESMMGELIPPANTLRLPHGDAWASRRADASAYAGEYKIEQVHRSIGFDSTVANDLGAFRNFVMGSVEELVGRQHRVLFETIEEETESVDNVVSAAPDKRPADVWFEALSKVKFGANSDGTVPLPQVVTGDPLFGQKLAADLQSRDQNFKLRLAALIAEKQAEALKEEQNRLEKYENQVDDR